MLHYSPMKHLTSVRYTFEADVIRMLLETEGIYVELWDVDTITWNPLLSNALGGIRIMVEDEDYAAACEILKQRNNAIKQDNLTMACGAGAWLTGFHGL